MTFSLLVLLDLAGIPEHVLRKRHRYSTLYLCGWNTEEAAGQLGCDEADLLADMAEWGCPVELAKEVEA